MGEGLFHNGLTVQSPLLGCEEAVAYSVGWDAVIRQTEKRHPLLVRVSGFHTPHIQFGSTEYNAPFLVRGVCPDECVVLTYNVTEGVINYRNRRFERNELLIMTHDEEMDLVIGDRNTTFTVAVEESFFRREFEEYYGVAFEGCVAPLALDHGTEEQFESFLSFWLRYFLKREGEYLLPQEYAAIEGAIMEGLFSFLVIEGQKFRSENRILKEGRKLLERHLDDHLKLSDTARLLGVSQRTLEYTFKRELGMTPKRYLQIQRLHAIRDELKVADPRVVKVSDIALKYAFFHLGHFASEYKKLFGESPAQTLRNQINVRSVFFGKH